MNNLIVRTIVLILVVTIFNFKAKGQQIEKNLKNSVKSYHEMINIAELNICQNNFKDAINEYKEAFELINSPFPEDIFNYILLNVYEKDYAEALNFSKELVKLGAELKFFDQIPLKELKSYTGWKEFEDSYPSLRLYYTLNTNQLLRQELISLENADQNNYCGQIKRPYNQISQDSIFDRLSYIISEYGYPNHNLIGLFLRKDTIITSNPQDVILIHLFQNANKNSIMVSEIIKKEIYEGKLRPEKAVVWLDYINQGLSHYGKMKFQLINGEIYFDKYSFEINNYQWFENNRKEILATSFQDAGIKMYYQIKHPNSKFILKALGVVIFENESNSKDKSLVNKFTKIEKLDSNFKNLFPEDDSMDSIYSIKNNFINEPLRNYYKFINNAELSICNHNYSIAIELYLTAFKNIESPFPKDIFNLIICSIYEKNYSLATRYGKVMISLGANLKFFDQIPLNKLKTETKYWNKIVKSYSNLHEIFLANTDFELKQQFEGLQNEFKDTLSYSHYGIHNCDDIFLKYIDIIKKKGYPEFKKIGIRTINDTLISDFDNIISYYFGFVDENNDISEILLSDVFRGNIPATKYLLFNNYFNKTDNKFGTPVLCKYYGNEYYTINTKSEDDKKQIKRIEENRKNTMNCSLEEELKKQIFTEKHKNLKFNFQLSGMHQIYNIAPYRETKTYKKINLDDYN